MLDHEEEEEALLPSSQPPFPHLLFSFLTAHFSGKTEEEEICQIQIKS